MQSQVREGGCQLDTTTNAQKDVTCADPAADLSLVMYNTATNNEENSGVLSNTQDDQTEGEALNEDQLRTLTMFDAGFKTFFPNQAVAQSQD